MKRNIINFCFPGFANCFLKHKKFFKVAARKFNFSKYKVFFQSSFFKYFSSLASSLLKIFKLEAEKLHFWKYKKSFNLGARKFHFLKYEKKFNLGARKFNFLKYNKFFWVDFFYFFKFGLKIAPGGPIIHYSLPTVLKF